MIYTLTLNSAIDMTIISPDLIKNGVTRSSSESYSPNGKGINVSILLSHNNVVNTPIAVLGGFTGHYIYNEMLKINDCITPIWVEEDTRINIFINQNEDEYKIVGKGAFVSEEKQQEILSLIGKFNDKEDMLIVSGSMPPGINDRFLIKIAELCKNKGIKTVFDISSPILKELLKYKPFLIKPNDEELLSIFGIEINSDRDVINAFKSLKEIGAQNIMLTLGAKGMYVNYLNKIYYAAPIEVKLISSACAGDSSLGAFISKMETDVIEAIKLATATGANVAESHGIGDLKNVEQYKNKVSIREVSYE